MVPQDVEKYSRLAIDAAFRVHSTLGPGLLESSYKACLALELAEQGLHVATEVPVPLVYKGRKLAEVGYRLDLLIERQLVLELKCVEAVLPVHRAQLLSYLRLANKPLGLLINFNVPHLKGNIWRLINTTSSRSVPEKQD